MLYFYTTHTYIYIYTIVQMYDACVVCVFAHVCGESPTSLSFKGVT